MSANSSIEWTDATWNPTTGCTKISPGCANCYIERTTPFRTKHRKFDDKGHIPIVFHPNRLDQPYIWKEPKRVFVNSLSDLFHPDIPFKFIAEVFTVMAQTTRHQYQVLTKRPERLLEFYDWNYPYRPDVTGADRASWQEFAKADWLGSFGHILFGVTVENRHFKSRIDTLRQLPGWRFLSIEPLLEDIGELDLTGIHWVIVGGESGPGARTFNVAWARSIIKQCEAQHVPCFMKQLGSKWVDAEQFAGVRGSCVVPVDAPWTWLNFSSVEKYGDIDVFPADIRVRQFPTVIP